MKFSFLGEPSIYFKETTHDLKLYHVIFFFFLLAGNNNLQLKNLNDEFVSYKRTVFHFTIC